MDLLSLDLKQLCANMWVPTLAVGSGAPSAKPARMSKSASESDPWGPGSRKKTGKRKREEPLGASVGRHLVLPHSPPPQDPAQGANPSTKVCEYPRLLPSAPLGPSLSSGRLPWPVPRSIIEPVDGPLPGDVQGLAPGPLAAAFELA